MPAHLAAKVKEGLDKDVRTGVLTKVGVNEPTRWCSRMVVMGKKNSKVRRTVGFKALNREAPRQTHATEAPFILASQVPPGSYKTCLDAWDAIIRCPSTRMIATTTTDVGPIPDDEGEHSKVEGVDIINNCISTYFGKVISWITNKHNF